MPTVRSKAENRAETRRPNGGAEGDHPDAAAPEPGGPDGAASGPVAQVGSQPRPEAPAAERAPVSERTPLRMLPKAEEEAATTEPRAAPSPEAHRSPVSLVVRAGPRDMRRAQIDLDSAPANEAVAPSPPAPAAIARPLLASEALMEELAPREPARRDARKWCFAVGAGFIVFGALPLLKVRPGGAAAAIPSLVTGAIALVAGLSRVSYRQRAVAMVVLGVLSGVVGLHGSGALLTSAVGGMGWGLTRMVAAVALAAALYFRTRYRAYSGARVFLAGAYALSVPFLVHACLQFTGGFGGAQIGSIVALAAIAASLTGFMGAESTGLGLFMAPTIVTALAIELSLRALWSPGATRSIESITEVATAAIAFAGAVALAAIGLFQIFAWRFGADARRIDLHPSPEPPESRDDPGSDWSTRE